MINRDWKIALLWFCLLGNVPILGQELTRQTGLHYYAIENLDEARVEQRGTAGANGIAHDNLILRPQTRYRDWILQAATLKVGFVDFTSNRNGRFTDIPPIIIRTVDAPDSDGDGLHDIGERIMGTDENNPDSDDDGILDGAEVQQGLDPLDGVPARTGILASRDTPGDAVDICAVNELVIVANGSRGISVFNVFNGLDPTIVAEVETPGMALAVHCSGSLVAVADNTAGLAIIDISDPPAAGIVSQLSQTVLGGSARSVVTGGGIAYVGLNSGDVAVVDLATATLLEKLDISGGAVQDVTLSGDYLYIMKDGMLHVVENAGGVLQEAASVSTPSGINTANGRGRLFVGDTLAYAVYRRGYAVVDVSNPEAPTLVNGNLTPLFGWKQIVTNGSGLGIAAVSPNQAFDGPHHVSLFDVTNPADNNAFIAEFPTPSVARAVTIFNGLAYVADHQAGMHVVNYLAFDAGGIPPEISLSASFLLDPATAEEGKQVRVTASVSDDVQVRNVEFFINDQRVRTDGNFPFEYRFVTPLIKPGVTESFVLRARASDTGGNVTWTDPIVVTLTPDATPPELVRVAPRSGSALSQIGTIAAFFNEPMDPASFSASSFSLVEAGADGTFGTGDDAAIAATIEWREEVLGAFLNVAGGLNGGFYRAQVTTGVADLLGNRLEESTFWTFRTFAIANDRDGDGVPDDVEPLLGLDPDNPDTDGDGIFDGDEDFDGDGLTNFEEIIIGFDPANGDSDGDGTADNAEDTDGDGITDVVELIAHGTDFNHYDTDGDGFNDGDEINGNGDPLNPASIPEAVRRGMLARLSVQNVDLPILVSNRKLGPQVSLQNRALPELLQGKASGKRVAVRNQVVPGLQQGKAEGPRASVENTAAPELVQGDATSPVVSAENQGN